MADTTSLNGSRFIGKPCRICSGTLRYRSGSCVSCRHRRRLERDARHRQGRARGENDGRRKHPLYNLWIKMHERCESPRCKVYRYYGARGIRVHPDWHGPAGFWHFVEHVGDRPAGTSLDRIDPSGDYEPGNVRWSSQLEQTRNTAQCKRTPERLARLRELRAAGWTDVAIAGELGVSNVLVARWAADLGIGPSQHSWRYRPLILPERDVEAVEGEGAP